ncbi:MAG: hypothetical protein JWP76_4617 [Dactylosporangium sp.]|jgi:hypothetical protein|nr:hypothetical protein [Dactylosporangium sp.]
MYRERSPVGISSPQEERHERTGEYTLHGDWINAWDPKEFERRMNNCIRAGYVCGTDGNPSIG